MALRFLPMHVLLNKRFSRTFALAALVLVSVSLAGYWTASPRLRDNARDRLPLPSWLRPGPDPSETDAAEPEFYPYETTSQFSPVSMDVAGKKTADLCASFPSYLTQRIQPVLKMGRGEARAKVEAQLASVSACFAPGELLVFSDWAETLAGGHAAIDILADLPASYRRDNRDLDAYLATQEMRRNGTLDEADADAVAARAAVDGWRLDKYKFLPGVERAWAMRPGRDWYVFYETDTYVVWDNLFRFLGTLDPTKPLYIGSPSPGREDDSAAAAGGSNKEPPKKTKTWFANGGPGYVLSRAAVEALLARRAGAATGRYADPPLAARWEELLRRDCCGDSVLGWTLWNASVPVAGYWPLFNPHALHNVPYSDLYWCQPVVTLHKTTPADMVELWRWEHGRRLRDKPLLYQDLWSFRQPGGPDSTLLENWDNGGWAEYPPPAETKPDSAATCRSACEASDRCVQFLWRGREARECVLMFQVRLGRRREPDAVPVHADEALPDGSVRKVVVGETKVDYTSGWMAERIARWRDQRPCEVVQWVGPSIERVY